ncbi:uncharacterized protein LOC101453502 [Ceratitis capitata]|uniref:(Mediterranean fruit fly) hypothetical protein n=1 Tax=Ceratitis capitata TaxID=7213 RepID=W8AW48_CERCA|nr:uncharacterized protein LOC101453502 [Ceratitis capitata]CAD7004518.1 unnamed protein product [Ceratitis capitata]
MSGQVNDNGIAAHIDIKSRILTPVSISPPSTAAVASSAMVCTPILKECEKSSIQVELPVNSAISCHDAAEIKNNSNCEESQLNGGLTSLSLMQSPPPHSYRHSRAYRHFKNPPQPHMCIRTTTESGEELFINVLSWTRIVIPQEPTDPIPLYGGMRVPPGSPRSPPIVFAVMANPEVLKDSGRHSKDPEERRAMVELMCDFVEAMNPGVKLVRNAVILKDRDISGELKDVWSAVQAQRDREREEQMIQQRQQHHFHNFTTQQMFPKSTEVVQISEQKQFSTISTEKVDKLPFDGLAERTMIIACDSIPSDDTNIFETIGQYEKEILNNKNYDESNEVRTKNSKEEIASCGENLLFGKDQIDFIQKSSAESGGQSTRETSANITREETSKKKSAQYIDNNSPLTSNTATMASTSTLLNATGASSVLTSTNPIKITTLVSATTSATTTTKKDKLVGFLPNGCIFPRFKNYKNREKDKDKETKTKDKEKTLLNALKKNKDKKVAPIEICEKSSMDNDSKVNYEKNCIRLESEIQKLDLNKIENPTSSENMFAKLKVTTSATAK